MLSSILLWFFAHCPPSRTSYTGTLGPSVHPHHLRRQNHRESLESRSIIHQFTSHSSTISDQHIPAQTETPLHLLTIELYPDIHEYLCGACEWHHRDLTLVLTSIATYHQNKTIFRYSLSVLRWFLDQYIPFETRQQAWLRLHLLQLGHHLRLQVQPLIRTTILPTHHYCSSLLLDLV